MAGMLRRLFTFASALSLLLCVGACALWVRSYRRYDIVTLRRSEPDPARREIWYRIEAVAGQLTFSRIFIRYEGDWRDVRSAFQWKHGRPGPIFNPDAPITLHERLGFDFLLSDDTRNTALSGGNEYEADLYLPYWLFAFVTVLLPARHAGNFYRRRRRAHSLKCVACGYDLRATHGRCPECGTVRTVPEIAAGKA
jgi:hypothetical protein